MEGTVWSDPEVMKRLKNNFVIASLYVDVHDIDLQPNEIYFSKALNKKITTLGDKNADMQVSIYNANTQPYYFFLMPTKIAWNLKATATIPMWINLKTCWTM